MIEVKDSPVEQPIEIEIGGKMYQLTFPIPSVWAFEDATGIDIIGGTWIPPEVATIADDNERGLATMNALLGVGGRTRSERVIHLLVAGLRERHPEMTFQKVSSLVYFSDVLPIANVVVPSFFACLVRSEKKVEQPAALPLEQAPIASVV